MRHLFMVAATVAASLFILSCLSATCVTGKGDVVKRTLDLPAVHAITLQGSLDVELTQGTDQSVEVEGQANLVGLVETVVKDGHWTIRTSECYNTDKPFLVRLRVRSMDRLSVQGSGDVKSTGTFVANAFDLDVQGSGDIKMNVQGGAVKATVQGSGAVKLSGTCDALQSSVQGSGDVKASELTATKVTAEVMGSGDIEVRTNGVIDGQVMGSGDVRYLGTPSSVNVTVTGSGNVSPIKTK